MEVTNVFYGIINFLETIFEGAVDIWAFLTIPLGIGSWTFTPLDILVAGLGVLITALLVKKLVPLV